ncbi:unnamed protein product [Dracunculus medinensis]|uniref:ATG11 domain-containing protein n=1 Tax=Dracunculus medinensis TaxID=318479 RepID=A0A0N4UR31_DRAME|nr:unnamed protein product [Dracunculus medinensis]
MSSFTFSAHRSKKATYCAIEPDFTILSKKNACVETIITMRDMRRMISIENIQKDSVVFLTWSDLHKAFKLFSVSPMLYFVKESSLRRIGIVLENTDSRPNCLIAVVASMECCQIRKSSNRSGYGLAMGERFYRVEVDFTY